jgi:2-oxoisovalerate dehydrogenase E1 component beta subunit
VIDLQTIYPYDSDTLIKSVLKTGRCIVTHEAPSVCGMGSEISALLQEKCFLSLKAPVTRVCGYDTPFPLIQEPLYLPTEWKIYEKVLKLMNY